MTDTRERILSSLRMQTSPPAPEPAVPVRRFAWDLDERLDRFQRTAESVRTEVHRVDGDWPLALARLLQQKGASHLRFGPLGLLAAELVGGWPEDGPTLIVHDEPIETCRDALFSADAGFTSCRGAIAETGSLVLWPGPSEPRLLSLVPPIHCVLLEGRTITSTLQEMILDQGWSQGMPTNALLISGPSRSADIEQTITYGVHGPTELIVLLRP